MKTKLLLGTAVLALSFSNLASAEEKNIVLDTNGNVVTTKDGVCVTHDFPRHVGKTCENFDPTVYFGLGSSSLDAKGKKVLDEVAASVKGDEDAKITLKGHADRKGNAKANQALSERRVNAVKKGLVARGVKADAITTETFGEDANAVATADNVAERLNRRVEIEVTK